MKHANELLNQVNQTLKDRGESYGPPEPLFRDIAKRWALTLGVKITPEQVVICMIDLKMARLKVDIENEDNLLDIVGYAGVLKEIINRGMD